MVIARGNDNTLRGFYNVCRHHAAAVMTEPEGKASQLRCPYHGWTYSLSGELKGTPDFAGVCNFDRSTNGLVSIDLDQWEKWVFVRLGTFDPQASLQNLLGADLIEQIRPLELQDLHWLQNRLPQDIQ